MFYLQEKRVLSSLISIIYIVLQIQYAEHEELYNDT